MGLRLAQISDLHLPLWPSRWRSQDWTWKRLAGWINTRWLLRSELFALAEVVTRSLVRDILARRPDAVVLCGDVVCLGMEEEFAQAAALLQPLLENFPGLAVPGNHDHYCADSVASGAFEHHFSSWQKGVRVRDATYPFAVAFDTIGIFAVNSAQVSSWPWDTRGQVGPQQLKHLQELMELSTFQTRRCLLVTHYPYTRADGSPETYFRRLSDADALAELIARYPVQAWLHGHRHHPYVLPPDIHRGFALICSGSATQRPIWSYYELDWRDQSVQIAQRCYWLPTDEFVERNRTEIPLASML